jgi:hypothetical protein
MAKLVEVHEQLDRGDATKDHGAHLPSPQLMNINDSTMAQTMVSMIFTETPLLELKV